MQEYEDKQAFIAEIQKAAANFIKEYEEITEDDKDLRMETTERTPFENLAYQLGWIALINQWEQEEKAGKIAEMPAPGIKWNRLGPLYEKFYTDYRGKSLAEMVKMFNIAVNNICQWVNSLTDDELFKPGGRKWARSYASNWPVWKWVHINTVAPFKTFRTKIRKWKKIRLIQ